MTFARGSCFGNHELISVTTGMLKYTSASIISMLRMLIRMSLTTSPPFAQNCHTASCHRRSEKIDDRSASTAPWKALGEEQCWPMSESVTHFGLHSAK